MSLQRRRPNRTKLIATFNPPVNVTHRRSTPLHQGVPDDQRAEFVRHRSMLSIGKLSVGHERYYLDHAAERVDIVESVAGGAEDYYLDPAEARGRWLGAGATQLGLAGDVGDEELRRVLAGLWPKTGEPLRRTNPRLTVSGYDLTFSAP